MTIQTFRNVLHCFSIHRLWNLIVIFISYQLSKLAHRSIVWGFPYTLTIEPTNRCNLQCPECPSGNGELVRPLGSMELNNFIKIVDQIHRQTFYLQLFFQGEPFINASLREMICYAHKKRVYVAISTNAHFIREEVASQLITSGLDKLIVSIDGLTEESYQNYRIGGKLSKVLDALRILRDTRLRVPNGKRMEVVLQFLVTKQNEHELPQLKQLAEEYHASVSLKTMQVYSAESALAFLPSNEHYRRYTMKDGQLHPKSKLKNQCVRLWERSVITWDGVVVPCCFDKNARYPLGTVHESDFFSIWQSDSYHGFRKDILSNRRGIPMCTNCTEGLKVYR